MEQQDTFTKAFESFNIDEDINVETDEASVEYAIYSIVEDWENIGLENILKVLLRVEKIAKKIKYTNVLYICKEYALECYLALRKYEEFLYFSSPPKIYSICPLDSIDLRLSIQKKLGLEANPLDVYRTHFPRQSKIVKSNPKLFEEKLIIVFDSYAKDQGGWFKIFESSKSRVYSTKSFTDNFPPPMNWGKFRPTIDVQINNYVRVASKELHATIKSLTIEAENLTRKNYGLPKIEIPWRTESLLYRRLKNEFPNTTVILHGKPDWLGKQHFDIWIPEWKIAVEYQGMYHFEPINGRDELEKAIERDKRKMELALKNGVDLFLETSGNHDELIARIHQCLKEKGSL